MGQQAPLGRRLEALTRAEFRQPCGGSHAHLIILETPACSCASTTLCFISLFSFWQLYRRSLAPLRCRTFARIDSSLFNFLLASQARPLSPCAGCGPQSRTLGICVGDVFGS